MDIFFLRIATDMIAVGVFALGIQFGYYPQSSLGFKSGFYLRFYYFNGAQKPSGSK